MSLAAWMPSSLRFFSICLLRARAARSSADEAQPMAIARTAWLATRGSAVLLACSRPVVARKYRQRVYNHYVRMTGRAPWLRRPESASPAIASIAGATVYIYIYLPVPPSEILQCTFNSISILTTHTRTFNPIH